MADEVKKVKVKLFDSSYVGGKLRAKNEIVEVREDLVEHFGEPVKEEKPAAPKPKES